jgi:ParB family chromosome partitioning protein
LEALLGRAPKAEPREPQGTFESSYGDDTAGTVHAIDLPEPSGVPQPHFAFPPTAQRPEEPPTSCPKLPIGDIDSNPFQPRQEFDEAEIQSLSESLRAHGLLAPVVVRKAGQRYQLVAGERRLRAATLAGWSEVPVQIVEADERQLAELAIVENLHRKDLGPLEKARSFQRYLEQYACTQEELASRLNLDRSTIANLIRLLELPEAVCRSLREGKITPGHARALLPLGDEREQIAFSERIEKEGLNVRQTEAMVQEMIEQADAEPLAGDGEQRKPRGRRASEHVAALEQDFRSALGVRVKLTHTANGRGKLTIPFTSHEEFERLREHICGTAIPGKG